MAATDERTEQVFTVLDAIWAAYEAGSPDFFDFFTEDVSIFSGSVPTRLAGREAYRRYFGPHIQYQRRANQILQPEIRLLPGGAALVTYHNRIRVNHNSVDNRSTLLFVPSETSLKIAHMHVSPLVVPPATDTEGLVEEVTAVEVATPRPGGPGEEGK
jgi:hypothetical protein